MSAYDCLLWATDGLRCPPKCDLREAPPITHLIRSQSPMTSQSPSDLREAPPIAPLIRSQSPVSPPLAISVQELEAQWQVFDSLLHELRERRVRPETYAFG